MKFAYAAVLVIVVGCHKGNKAGTGSAEPGSAAIVGSAGSAAPGSAAPGSAAPGSAGSAVAGSAAGSASPELIAALDDLDRWIAPAMKLDPHPRIVALSKDYETLREKAEKMKAMGPPPGVAADAWSETVDDFRDQIGSVGLCAQNLKDYDKLTKAGKNVADDTYEDCTKQLPDAFAAVVKLVPGAKPPGTHANDPVMTAPAK